jgi:hypothetical protein
MKMTVDIGKRPKRDDEPSIFRAMPGYPWLDPCPRCGFRGSCDCTVFERARAAHPGLVIPSTPKAGA